MWNGKMALVGFEPFTGICFCSSVVYPLSNQSVKQQLSLRSPSDPSPKINKLLFPVHHILQPQIQIRILVLSCMLYHRGGVQKTWRLSSQPSFYTSSSFTQPIGPVSSLAESTVPYGYSSELNSHSGDQSSRMTPVSLGITPSSPVRYRPVRQRRPPDRYGDWVSVLNCTPVQPISTDCEVFV